MNRIYDNDSFLTTLIIRECLDFFTEPLAFAKLLAGIRHNTNLRRLDIGLDPVQERERQTKTHGNDDEDDGHVLDAVVARRAGKQVKKNDFHALARVRTLALVDLADVLRSNADLEYLDVRGLFGVVDKAQIEDDETVAAAEALDWTPVCAALAKNHRLQVLRLPAGVSGRYGGVLDEALRFNTTVRVVGERLVPAPGTVATWAGAVGG